MDALVAQEAMEHINNRFVKNEEAGEFTIAGGYLSVSTLADGQWYWIEGSIFNDGLHQYTDSSDGESDLIDETFEGCIYGLAIPRTFETLVEDIEAWLEAHPASASGYTSESFGGYSYSLPTTDDGTTVTVYDVFSNRLNKWRRLPCL